jgi:hypothetical protein
VVGVIYSPNHQTSRLVEAAVAWRTGQSDALATSPGRWVPTVGALLVGLPGCPVAHQTSPVDCPVCHPRVLCPLRAFNALQSIVAREVAVGLLAHRTVRCAPDMSGEC